MEQVTESMCKCIACGETFADGDMHKLHRKGKITGLSSKRTCMDQSELIEAGFIKDDNNNWTLSLR